MQCLLCLTWAVGCIGVGWGTALLFLPTPECILFPSRWVTEVLVDPPPRVLVRSGVVSCVSQLCLCFLKTHTSANFWGIQSGRVDQSGAIDLGARKPEFGDKQPNEQIRTHNFLFRGSVSSHGCCWVGFGKTSGKDGEMENYCRLGSVECSL